MVLTKARDATLWHPQTHRFRLDSDRCLPLTFERYLRAEVDSVADEHCSRVGSWSTER